MIDSLSRNLLVQNKQLQDSLKHLSDKLHQEPISGLDVLNKVNTFYDSSWNKLLWVVGALLALIGVVIPLVIQYYQNKKVKTSENQLRKEIESSISNAIDLLKNDINDKIEHSIISAKQEINDLIEKAKKEMLLNSQSQIDAEVKILDVKFDEIQNKLFGRTYHLQATMIFENEPIAAFVYFMLAIRRYAMCTDISVCKELFKFLINNSAYTKKGSKELIETELKKMNFTYETFVADITENDLAEILKISLAEFVTYYKNIP